MGMKGIYYDVVRMPEELEKELGVEYVDFETLLRTADVVFLLVPLNALCVIQNTIFTRQFRFARLSKVVFTSRRPGRAG